MAEIKKVIVAIERSMNVSDEDVVRAVISRIDSRIIEMVIAVRTVSPDELAEKADARAETVSRIITEGPLGLREQAEMLGLVPASRPLPMMTVRDGIPSGIRLGELAEIEEDPESYMAAEFLVAA